MEKSPGRIHGIDKDLIQGLTEREVQVEHLESVIVSLSTKIHTINDMDREQTRSRQLIREGESGREHLQVLLNESAQKTAQRARENKDYQDKLVEENKQHRHKIDDQEQTIRNRDNTIHEKTNTIGQRERTITEQNLALENLKEMKRTNEQLSSQINESQQRRNDLQSQFERAISDHAKEMDNARADWKKQADDYVNTIRQRDEEIRQLKKTIYDNEQRFEDERRALKKRIDELTSEVAQLKDRLVILDEIKQQRDQLQANLKKYQESRDQLHRDIENLKQEYHQLTLKDQQHFDQLIAERKQIELTLKTRETTITEHTITIKRLETHRNELEQVIDSLNDKLEALKDIKAQFTGAQAVIAEITAEKDKLRQELNTAGDFMLDLEQKVHKANNTSLELLRQLKDAESEIDALKEYIIELKSRVAVYIPVREDDVDKRLAEYINNYPDRSKLKIMFMRESEGIYLFGTRKIYVRVEQGKIIIRVGGGYLTIDEFLDIYTPVELERLERKDPLKKFSEKVAVQRNLVGREIRESSPVRASPTRSSPVRSPSGRKSPKKTSPSKRQ